MSFQSTPEQRTEMVTACKVLTFFRIVEGFGHISSRIPDSDRILMTPRRALGIITADELIELDADGKQVAGDVGRPALESIMHIAVYRRRSDVNGIARGHPRNVAAFACAGEPLRIAHGFGANLGPIVRVTREPYLVHGPELAEAVADALGTDSEAVILRANGMLSVGQSVPHACVQALFLEEAAELQLKAQAAGMTPQAYTPEGALRRHGDDRVHEPIRAWEYYVAAAEGQFGLSK